MNVAALHDCYISHAERRGRSIKPAEHPNKKKKMIKIWFSLTHYYCLLLQFQSRQVMKSNNWLISGGFDPFSCRRGRRHQKQHRD